MVDIFCSNKQGESKRGALTKEAFKEEGTCMTTTDMLRYVQDIVGMNIKLPTKSIGSGFNKVGLERVKHYTVNRGGYWVNSI